MNNVTNFASWLLVFSRISTALSFVKTLEAMRA